MTLQNRLFAFIAELPVDRHEEISEQTSLIHSGLLDSLALLTLAEWIEQEVGSPVDPTTFDLVAEWDTVARIVNFITQQR